MGIKTRGYTDEDRKKGRTERGAGGGPFPPEGTYEAKVDDARYFRGEGRNGPYEKLELQLKLAAGDPTKDPPVRRGSWFTDDTAAMANVIDAIGKPDDPEELEPDDMIGRRCRAVVKHSKPNGEGKSFANIVFLLPPGNAGRQEQREAPRQEQRREAPRQERRDAPREQRPVGGRTYGGNVPADDSDLPF